MVQPQYTAGFQFIVSTPSEKLDKHHRKTIRGHATRAGRPTRQAVKLSSWISPERRLDSTLNPPSPGQVGAAFSGLQLPPGVEPYMIQELVKLIDLSKHGVYPYDICLNVHIVERGWFPYMISDICCLHSMMFSVKAFVENAPGGQLSHSASLHYARTLQLLQARLNEPDQTAAISDSTIMVVVTLAAAAEITGDAEAVANHARGLDTIVGLRGGVRALTTHNNLQVKVCR
ncbi:hypothetical protein PVAG01_11237 [Phlyctema vagabunda]|uniref:Uncharacterized protein n=1 Tax=Phlyctema vagabunda TaxID=108571 RepID=A0ABR4P1R4_9HELO